MKKLLLSLLTPLFFIGASAQKKVDSVQTNDLAEVVVRSVIDLDARKNASSSKLVYTSKDFERFELTTIGDYLRSLPGVVMDKGNEAKDVKFRGLDKEYTQILIDGERIPDGGEKREFQVDRIPLNMVERIEILRTPTANMDAQGMAGTINIVLKKAMPHPTLRLNASVGKVEEHGTVYDSYLQYGNAIGKNASFLLNGGYQTREAPKAKTKESYKNGVLQSGEDEVELKKYKEANFAPRLNWNIAPKHSFNFDPMLLYSQEDKGVTKPSYKYSANKIDTTSQADKEVKDRTGWALRATYTFRPSEKHVFTFRPIYQAYEEQKDKTAFKYNNKGVETEANTETEDKSDREFINRVTYQFLGNKHNVQAAIEAGQKKRERSKAKTKNGAPDKIGVKDLYFAEENRVNAYLMDEFRIAPKHFITPAIRWEYTKGSNTSYFKAASGNDTAVARSNNYNTLNPSLNYLYNISNSLNFRLGMARTVRRPQFDQLTPFLEEKKGTLAEPDNAGNPLLEPETSLGGDAGLDFFFGKEQKLGVFGVNAFYRDVNDYMESQVNLDAATNRYVSRTVNAGDGKVWGFEFDVRYAITVKGVGQFIPKANYSILRSEVLDTKTGQLRKFKNQPDYVYNIGLEYVMNNRRFSIGANFNKVPINQEPTTKDDGSYEVKENTDIQRLDVFLNYTVNRKLAVRLAGQNLLTQTKEVRKSVYNTTGQLTSYDVERENYASTLMLSLQWNFR